MNNSNPPTSENTLESALADAWRRLQAGVDSGEHPFHYPALCTTAPDGSPDARTVVLRKADPITRTLLCHTDARAPKITHLQHNPASAWLFYDHPDRIQLRILAHTTLHTHDPLADAQWHASANTSRRCYLAPFPPGQPADPPDHPTPNLPFSVQNRVPTTPETAPARPRFAVLQASILSIDWLYLHHAGHRRALFTFHDRTPTTPPTATWLNP